MVQFPLSKDKAVPGCPFPFVCQGQLLHFCVCYYISLILDLPIFYDLSSVLLSSTCNDSLMTPVTEKWWNLHILICFSWEHAGLGKWKWGKCRKWAKIFWKYLSIWRCVKYTSSSCCIVLNCLKMNNGNLVLACIFSHLIFKSVCPRDSWLKLGSTAETVSPVTQTLWLFYSMTLLHRRLV